MAKCLFVKDYLAALCFSVGALGPQSLFAQEVPQIKAAPVAPAEGCVGVLCALTPGSMDRPILADEAARIRAEAERDGRPTVGKVATARRDRDTSPRVAQRKPRVAVAHRGQDHAIDGRSVAARPVPIAARGRATNGPINEIFVLAARPFDPYGGDYAPWLDRLAWSTRFDRAGDRTVFSADGYREADVAPTPELPTVEANAAEDLSRRLNALSKQGFQASKADLGGG